MKAQPATRITMMGAPLAGNLGGPSLLVSTITALDSVFANGDYTLLVPPGGYDSDKVVESKYGVQLLPLNITRWSLPVAILRRLTRCWIGGKGQRATMEAFEQADAVIDIWGIVFADALGQNSFKGRLAEGLRFLVPKVLGKPIIKYTADIGPFTQKWNRFFARFYLQHCVDLILARDATTKRDIEELGVTTPIRQVPDTAFLLEPRKSDLSVRLAEIRREKPVICLSVSFMARRHARSTEHYRECMTGLARHVINRHGAHVVLLPNQVSRSGMDDNDEAREICARVAHSGCEVIQIEDHCAQEIKGIIQQSDLAIAARYHTIVAALSMGIPTLGIGWHHKYRGVFSLYGQEEWVCDMGTLNGEGLTAKFEEIWAQRDQIRNTILREKPDVESAIYAAAEEVFRVLHARRAGKSAYSSDPAAREPVSPCT